MTERPAEAEHRYRMTIGLSVLKHLGLNLYSNVPAVLSEAVANAWDADAETVDIDLFPDEDRIVIKDDSHGMDLRAINDRFLTVGFERRSELGGGRTPVHDRPVMGRKGIGKLSLLSTANVVEVHSVKDGERSAFKMVLHAIEQTIKDGTNDYFPDELSEDTVDFEKGTRLVLTQLKKGISNAGGALRKRVARRFTVIGAEYKFVVRVDGEEVTVADRDYFHKVEYLWHYGVGSQHVNDCVNLAHDEARSHSVTANGKLYEVSGWIGTVERSGLLKDGDDNLNKITVLVRGKVAQEDVLGEFAEGGIYTKYVFGEINADFMDLDDQGDTATTSRQRFIEDEPRYLALKEFVQGELKHIQGQWTALRNKKGIEKAQEIPAVRAWLDNLGRDERRRAERLFGRINELTVEDEADRRHLIGQAVLAFETLRYKHNLDALDRIDASNLGALAEVFAGIDEIEATLYHRIARERVQVITTLREKVDDNAREKAIQDHLFDHLWLLDPSWERAAGSEYTEQQLRKEFENEDADLLDKEKMGRIDIKYRTASGKHIIVELKRAERVLDLEELLGQVRKYGNALRKLLIANGRADDPFEIVCVLGRPLRGTDVEGEKARVDDALATYGARTVFYTELIDNAYNAYTEWLDAQAKAGNVAALIDQIETFDVEEK